MQARSYGMDVDRRFAAYEVSKPSGAIRLHCDPTNVVCYCDKTENCAIIRRMMGRLPQHAQAENSGFSGNLRSAVPERTSKEMNHQRQRRSYGRIC